MINKKIFWGAFIFCTGFWSFLKSESIAAGKCYLNYIGDYKNENSPKGWFLRKVFSIGSVVYDHSDDIFFAKEDIAKFLVEIKGVRDAAKEKKITEAEYKTVENKLIIEVRDYFIKPHHVILKFLHGHALYFNSIVPTILKYENVDTEKSILVKFMEMPFEDESSDLKVVNEMPSPEEYKASFDRWHVKFNDFFIKELDTLEKSIDFCSDLEKFLSFLWCVSSTEIKMHSLDLIKDKNLRTDAEIEELKKGPSFLRLFKH